jgi:hypothetical protein
MVGEKYFGAGSILALAMRQKKISTWYRLLPCSHGKAEDCERTWVRHGQQRNATKPIAVQAYNDFMGGTDTSDMMSCTYLGERRIVQDWRKIHSTYLHEWS